MPRRWTRPRKKYCLAVDRRRGHTGWRSEDRSSTRQLYGLRVTIFGRIWLRSIGWRRFAAILELAIHTPRHPVRRCPRPGQVKSNRKLAVPARTSRLRWRREIALTNNGSSVPLSYVPQVNRRQKCWTYCGGDCGTTRRQNFTKQPNNSGRLRTFG